MNTLMNLLGIYFVMSCVTYGALWLYYKPQGSSERTIYGILGLLWPATLPFYLWICYKALR